MLTGPMVRVATVGDPIEARIIAARLGSEGLLWELRGGIDGPYPMGPVHVYVEEADYEVAHELIHLGADDLDEDDDVDERAGRAPLTLWLVVLAIVAVAAFGVMRVALGSGVGTSRPGTPAPSTLDSVP